MCRVASSRLDKMQPWRHSSKAQERLEPRHQPQWRAHCRTTSLTRDTGVIASRSSVAESIATRRATVQIVESDDVGLRGAACGIHGKDDEIIGAAGCNRDIKGEFSWVHGVGRAGCTKVNAPVALYRSRRPEREAARRTAAKSGEATELRC